MRVDLRDLKAIKSCEFLPAFASVSLPRGAGVMNISGLRPVRTSVQVEES